ncbi:MAG: hypothetical protein RJA29_2069 [Pseudomonadota bacterium]|jgi:hypothetical protein
MPLIDPDGIEWTRIGDQLIPDALPAVSGARQRWSDYGYLPPEFFAGVTCEPDYFYEGLEIGKAFTDALNQTLDQAFALYEFEAVHTHLPFGDAIDEIRRCIDKLDAFLNETLRKPPASEQWEP